MSKTGIFHGISNEDYHSGEGISKSGLDMIRRSPASYQWSKSAPTDDDKTKGLDFGTAFHCYLLEPEEFTRRYVIEPEINKRTNDGKSEAKAFAEKVKKAGLIVLTDADLKKIKLMHGSVMAHPTAKELLNLGGEAELSVYWNDDDTGELCRVRPDLLIKEHKIIIDVKTIADMSRLQRHIEEYRYYVQDSFYSDGLKAVTGDDYDFLFLFVSASINCSRYPVEVVRLTQSAKFDGRNHYRQDLKEYSSRLKINDWQSITEIDRPQWATRNEDQIL